MGFTVDDDAAVGKPSAPATELEMRAQFATTTAMHILALVAATGDRRGLVWAGAILFGPDAVPTDHAD